MTDKEKLEQKLWNIADTLRGKMGADDFRDYILGFIFYKYLSEKMHSYADKILKPDGLIYKEVDEDSKKGQKYLKAVREEALDSLGYFLKPSELFSEMARRGNGNGKNKFILDDLTKVLNNIAQSTMGTDSEEDFDHLFEDLDLTSSKLGKTESTKNELIVKVLVHLDEIDFRLEDTESDVLGDAYEYLIGQFASGAGKKAGEFYTPQQVSMILAKIVTTGKKKLKSVYDPTCGSGSLLLRVAKEVKEVGGFYGQESNPTTYNLCRMNMIMHNVHYRKFDIKNEDTLEHPQHIDQRFEAVVANPPFSANWSASQLFMNDDRFASYGKLAPKSKADFAFVQHMVHQLDNNGTMACVLPHGVLFRGAAEGHIRKYLIEDKNYLDAVIGLPANVFYGTSIPTCILVLKKKRKHTDNILFIDASQHFEKVKNQNFLREKDIEKIVSTFRKRKTEDKYSYVAALDEVREYVDTFEEEELVDLQAVSDELKGLEERGREIDIYIKECCEDLNIPKPGGHNLPLLKKYKKGVMQKLFSQEIRFKPALSEVEGDENGNDYPAWEEKRLGEIASFTKGKSISKSDIVIDGQLPCIRYGELYTLYSEVISEVYSSTNVESEELVLSKTNDVIIPSSGETNIDLATASCVLEDGIALGGDINIIRTSQNGVFLSYYLNNAKNIDIARLAQGNSVVHLYSTHLKTLKISLPIIEEQNRIADFVRKLSMKIESIQLKITQTQKFKKGLLQQMFV